MNLLGNWLSSILPPETPTEQDDDKRVELSNEESALAKVLSKRRGVEGVEGFESVMYGDSVLNATGLEAMVAARLERTS